MNLIEKMNASKEKETVQYTIVELFEMLKEKVAEINSLKAQLNNMEACYIEKKQQIHGLHTLILNWRGLKIKGIAPEHRAYEKALGDCADQLEQSMRGANA